MEFDRQEFGARVRAARAYADLEREELAGRMEINASTLKRWEYGQGKRPPSRHVIAAMAEGFGEACGLPTAFFTADLGQLDPGHQPPEDRLASLESTVRDLMAQLTRLAEQADGQLKDGSKKLAEFGQIIEATQPPKRRSAS